MISAKNKLNRGVSQQSVLQYYRRLLLLLLNSMS